MEDMVWVIPRCEEQLFICILSQFVKSAEGTREKTVKASLFGGDLA